MSDRYCQHRKVRLTELWNPLLKKWELKIHCERCSTVLHMTVVNPWVISRYEILRSKRSRRSKSPVVT